MDVFSMSGNNNDAIWKILTTERDDITVVLNSMANKRRLQILTALLRDPQTFRDLQKATKLGKTALAHHLGILVEAGVITHTARGQYELSPDGTELMHAIGSAYLQTQRRREQIAAKRADAIRRVPLRRKEDELKVRIVKLEPMRVASFHALGKSPEPLAAEKLIAWAKPRGMLEDPGRHPVYGFNNPDPQPGKDEYGYEFWIRVDPDFESDEVEIKDFEGGLYAVTLCKDIGDNYEKIGQTWGRLVEWLKASKYGKAHHQWLEKTLDVTGESEFSLELYAPISE
ncbi:MAG: effector binding domain-containing protein [Promethearchaeota archaeon]